MPIGEAHLEDLLAYGIPASRVRLLHMGVAPDFNSAVRKDARQPGAPLALVYVGTVSRARGRDVMLDAIAIANCHRLHARLTIIGASPEEKRYCEQRIRELGIADAVQILERIPGTAVPAALRHMDAGLCLWEDTPWWRFNPPTKLFEYLVAGLPVLASDIRTHTHYITHWHNGLVFDYDALSLAACIRHLWECRAELPNLKSRAHQSGEPFQWSKIEPQFLQAIESLRSGRKSRRAAAVRNAEGAVASPLRFRRPES
jgi:glycosyltransferase involved in cell wall biosynthesis